MIILQALGLTPQQLNKMNNAQHRRAVSSPAHYPMPETSEHVQGMFKMIYQPETKKIKLDLLPFIWFFFFFLRRTPEIFFRIMGATRERQ